VKDPDAVGLAEFVGETAPTTAVVIVREQAPDGLVPIAMRAGVRDVVDLSRGGGELGEALERAISWSTSVRAARGDLGPEAGADRGRIVSVFSSKGGTGKTFMASNLAVVLARTSGRDTALVDLDLSMGDVFSFFGAESENTLPDLLSLGEAEGHEQIRGLGKQLDEHLWGFAAPSDPAAESVPGETIGRLLRTIRGAFAQTVVDTPAGYADQVLAALDVSDEILMVVGLDVVALRHLSLAIDTLLSLGVHEERLRVVLNRADSKVGLDPEEVERVMGIRVDAMIPSSRLVPTSLNYGRPVVIDEPRSGVARAIEELAARTGAQPQPQPGKTKRKKRMFGRS
jgi:pilus assembly protein CpaE